MEFKIFRLLLVYVVFFCVCCVKKSGDVARVDFSSNW